MTQQYPDPPVDPFLRRPWTANETLGPDPRDPEHVEILTNSRYQVYRTVLPVPVGSPPLVLLSFKRHDRGIFIPYRDKQRMKNELIGTECEAVELYPAHSRERDTANQYYLWGYTDAAYRFPFGFQDRAVAEVSIGGARQEPWPDGERPADAVTNAEELLRRFNLHVQGKTMYVEQ